MGDFFVIRDTISLPGKHCNEDAFGWKISDDTLDLWVLDGATSVADEEFLGLEISDPAWFARSISQSLDHNISGTADPAVIIRTAVENVSARYKAQIGARHVPLYAYPLSALLWLRAQQTEDAIRLSMWSMGDSRLLISPPAAPVSLFPEMTRGDVTVHPSTTTQAAPEGRNRTGVLLSHAMEERHRREEKHTNPEAARLGFHPDSIKHAETRKIALDQGADILAMSDGFYRLVDEYHLYDDAALIQAARSKGLQPLYEELRAYERTQNMDHAVKKSDDATAILIRIGAEND